VIWALLILPLMIALVDWALWGRMRGMLSFPSIRWRWRRRRRMPWAAIGVWCVVAAKFLAPSSQPDWQSWVVVASGLAVLVWWVLAIYADLRE